jgi:hypothetical protein
MSTTVYIIRKRSKFVPVIVDIRANQVRASLSKHAARISGCTTAYETGVGERSVRALLSRDVDGFDSIRALRESVEFDRVEFERRPEFDTENRPRIRSRSRSLPSVG